MTKHEGFGLSEDFTFMLSFTSLFLGSPVFFAWGWFAPAMPTVGDLILAVIIALALAFSVKIVLKRIGKPGTLWTRALGGLTSVVVALGHLGLVWGVANGFRYDTIIEPYGAFLPLLSSALILHLPELEGYMPKGGVEVDCEFGGEVEYCEGVNCGGGLDYDSAPDCSPSLH
jgi:hypothetical protein